MENLAPLGSFGSDITGISANYFVIGRPVPQGSLKFINGRPIHERAQDLAVWRADIARGARSAMFEKIEGAAEVHLLFIFNQPKTVKRLEPFVRPDIDKLSRAVLDGLTGAAFDDDQQVTKLIAQKIYGEEQGVWITIIDRSKLIAPAVLLEIDNDKD